MTKLYDKLGDLAEALGPLIVTFLDYAITVIPIVIEVVGTLAGVLINFITVAIDPLIAAWRLIAAVAGEVWEWIKNLISDQIDQIKADINLLGDLPSIVGGFFGRMRDAIVEKLQEALDYIKSIPERILANFGDPGRILWDAGSRVIGGFIDGLKSRIGEIGSILGAITSSIPTLKGPPVVDEKLLTPNCQLIMDGLIAGFQKGERGVKAHLNALTKSIAGEMNMSQGAGNAARSVNSMTSKLGPGGAITQAAIAEAAATRAAITLSREGGDPNVDVTVVLGDEILNTLVTDVIVQRDKRTKRAVTAGGRRTP
jgi:phage-related protein